MTDCIFCKIIKKEIPAQIRYEDEDLIAFDDINPQAPVHILLLPKKHISSLVELNDQILAGKLLLVAKKVAKEAGLDNFRVVTNSGEEAGQTVSHLHFHILGGKRLGHIA